ncbi:MAG: putative nucleotide binding protein [Methanolobus sp.]|jgi:putative nucleotide binding protein|nr:putative nucleotide binding protein [Methanolobus sp.]MDK2912218.1 putative nucleotide binding protein [Methanolobus sp.]MDN5310283.1 putative nucleotide binding protein [Methanolobus sp.]
MTQIRGKPPEKEEYAWVLDYLPYGSNEDKRPSYQKKPVVQAIGERNFVLMELIPKEGKSPSIQSRVYIGEGDRDEIDHVKHRIGYTNLSHGAQLELPFILEMNVKSDEERFVKFFNDAHPITNRLHMLELLPGIGKKLMWAIIDERKKGVFKSLDDLHARVGGVHSPQKVIANRIIEELKDENIKYRLFTLPPKRPKE